MELDWSTFLLEVINFLILVWVLKRFLYQPVLKVIEQRRQKIATELAQAAQDQQAAQSLKDQYEARMAELETQRQASLDALEQQMAQERNQRLQALDADLEQQRVKHQARDQQQRSQWRTQAEAEALQLGGIFAARLLQALACPELDQRLQQMFLEQLAGLADAAVGELRQGWQDGAGQIEVVSAAPLAEEQQQRLRQALEQKLGPGNGQWQYTHDDRLIAGLRVSVGGWVLGANLQDELRFFAEAAHDS